MTEIDIKNFDRVLKLPKVVVKVGASWCGPCRMIAPVVDEVAEKIPEVPFYSVDVPLILFLEEGKEIHRITGMATIASIEHATTVLRDK